MDLQEDFRLRLLPKLAVVVPEWLMPHQGCIKAGDVGHAVKAMQSNGMRWLATLRAAVSLLELN
jgi:hypothetical protein